MNAPKDTPILIVWREKEDRDHLDRIFSDEFSQALLTHSNEAELHWVEKKPAVLILCLEDLAEAESLYLTLLRCEGYRSAPQDHQSVVLCKLSEANDAYEKCIKSVFDDYVVFHPLNDIGRVKLSTLQAVDRHRSRGLEPSDGGRSFETLSASASTSAMGGPGEGPASAPNDVAGPATDEQEDAITGMKALVVEDDEFLQEVYTEILSNAGFSVEVAGTGEQALLLASSFKPDLVTMDINLPTMNGVEATRRLRSVADTAATPILIASGRQDRVTVAQCIDAGANAYVVKPITEAKLLGKVRKLLGPGT